MGTNFPRLVKSLHQATRIFHESWRRNGYKRPEAIEVIDARNNAWSALSLLFNELERYEKDFLAGETWAIDAIIEFLEVDIPAFRCGYAKERYYRKLKSLALTEQQKDRIKNIAFKMSQSDNYRREFRDLARLMVKLADREFVEKMKSISENSTPNIKFKIRIILETILQNRLDLR